MYKQFKNLIHKGVSTLKHGYSECFNAFIYCILIIAKKITNHVLSATFLEYLDPHYFLQKIEYPNHLN